MAGGPGECVCARWGWLPVDLGQFLPPGGINLTKVSWHEPRDWSFTGWGWLPVDLGQFVPAGGINLTKIGKGEGDSVI